MALNAPIKSNIQTGTFVSIGLPTAGGIGIFACLWNEAIQRFGASLVHCVEDLPHGRCDRQSDPRLGLLGIDLPDVDDAITAVEEFMDEELLVRGDCVRIPGI